MFKWMRAHMQRGQAIVEYMPTIAGMMALGTIALIFLGGGVTKSYCKVVDAFGDQPEVCASSVSTEAIDSEGEGGDSTDESTDDSADETCVISLAGAEGEEWGGLWTPGATDTLVVNVANIAEPISWSASVSFPNAPDIPALNAGSGAFDEPGESTIEIAYPAEGEWGPAASDGSGRYEARANLVVDEPCEGVDWVRYYVVDAADLAIGVSHDVSPITTDGETLKYFVTVTNNGPMVAGTNNADGSGTMVQLLEPTDTTIVSATVADGSCTTDTVCDLGQMDVGESAVITVETTVPLAFNECDLLGTGIVSVSYPPDPDPSNNSAWTNPNCAVVCEMQTSSFSLVDASSGDVITNLAGGDVVTLDAGTQFSVVANVSDAGSVVLNGNGTTVTANSAPYSIGNWSAAGNYSVSSTPYAGTDGSGVSCGAGSVNFIINVEESVVCNTSVDGFSWVNTYTGAVSPLNDGDVIYLDTRDSISVIANASGAGSVVMSASDGTSRTDNDAAYSLTSASGSSYQPWISSTGTFTVTASPYTQANASGETCNPAEVTFTVANASRVFENDPGCPASHPVTLLTFDHQPIKPDGSDYTKALKNGSRRDSVHQTLVLNETSEIVLVASGSVGHPETGCPVSGTSCNQTCQTNESWKAIIDGQQVGYYPDTAEHQDVFLSHPNVYMTLQAGEYDMYIRHAKNNSGHSVGAFLRVCTQQ